MEMDVEGLRREASERAAEREAMREKTDRLHNELAKTRAALEASSKREAAAREGMVYAQEQLSRARAEAQGRAQGRAQG